MTDAELKRSLWVADSASRIAAQDRWEYLPGLERVLEANARTPLTSREWFVELSKLELLVQQSAGQPGGFRDGWNKFVDRSYEAIGDTYPLATIITEEMRELLRTDSLARTREITAIGQELTRKNFVSSEYGPRAGEILQKVYDLAAINPEVAASWEQLMARQLGTMTVDSAEIVRRNPSLQETHDLLKAAPTTAQAIAALSKQIEQLGKKVGAPTLPPLAKPQSSNVQNQQLQMLAEYVEEQRRAARQRAQEEALEGSLRGAIVIWGLLGGNPKTMRQLTAVLNAYKEVKRGIDTYNTAVAAGASTAMAGLGMVGVFVAVAMVLFAEFQEQQKGASFEEVAMRALEQISQQLKALHQDLQNGLVTLDRRLTDLSNQITAGFEVLFQGINQNRVLTQNVLDATYNLSRIVDNASREIILKLDYLIKQQGMEPLLNGMRYQQRFGKQLTQAEYQALAQAVAAFVDESSNPIFAGEPMTEIAIGIDKLIDSHADSDLRLWAKHINAYGSLVRMVAHDQAYIRCNPERLLFAVDALLQIHVNNAAEDVKFYPAIVSQLHDCCQALLDDAVAYGVADGPKFAAAMSLIRLLASKYVDEVARVEQEVLRIHRDVLDTKTALVYLGDYEEQLENAKAAAPRASSAANGAMPIAEAQKVVPLEPTMTSWANIPYAAAVVQQWWDIFPGFTPSTRRHETWPRVPVRQAVWDAFPADRRALALHCERWG